MGGLGSRGQGQGVQGWKMNCIRPAPPTRSFFQADKRNTLRRKEVEQSSYEDDLQILRVIEAYCFSKQRQTITNSECLECQVCQVYVILVLTLDPSDREDSCQPLLSSQCPACNTDRSEAYISAGCLSARSVPC